MTTLTLEALAKMINADFQGDGELMVTGVNSLDLATGTEVSYAESARYSEQVETSSAAVVVVTGDFPELDGVNLLRVDHPKIAFIQVTEWFYPTPPTTGIHSDASVHGFAKLGAEVTVGACAVISAEASIGEGTVIQPGAFIGPAVSIGENCIVEANAVLLEGVELGDRVIVHSGTTLGGDGYGYVWMRDHHHKVPQVGRVVVEDDVEIGCNSCIDRATFGVTRIGRGTKIDNLVHIAHNNNIGEDVIITGQVGTAGSVTVGNRAMFGGQAGVADHVTIGEGAMIGGATPVTHNITAGEKVWGFPGRNMAKAKREMASLSRLPELVKKVRQQERELSELRAQVAKLLALDQ